MIQAHSLRRLGAPQDVAEAALLLASDSSSWITGVILDVTGGTVFAEDLGDPFLDVMERSPVVLH